MENRLIFFTGTECDKCDEMVPIIKQLEAELNINLEKIEVWHSSENADLMRKYDIDENGKEFCGGIPFFYNEKTGAKICGKATLEELKKWAE